VTLQLGGNEYVVVFAAAKVNAIFFHPIPFWGFAAPTAAAWKSFLDIFYNNALVFACAYEVVADIKGTL
jgi:hypothetical protein